MRSHASAVRDHVLSRGGAFPLSPPPLRELLRRSGFRVKCSSFFVSLALCPPPPQLADTLAAVPRMRPEAFNRLFDDNLQDLLMVSYLSSLTRTQLAIAEKLAT